MKTLAKTFTLCVLFIASLLIPLGSSAGEHVLKTEINLPFDDAKERLKAVIEGKGYTFAHEQKCDNGLAKMGYDSNLYRVLFFGKLDEVREISKNYEALIPFIPFKVAIYEKEGKTTVSFLNPYFMTRLVKSTPEFLQKVASWEKDFQEMLNQMSTSVEKDS